MKIYIIYGNNGGKYDDYYEWIEGLYLAKGNALKEIERLKKEKPKDCLGFELQYCIKEFITKD